MTSEALHFGEDDATRLLRAYGLRLQSLTRIWKGTISQNFQAQTDIGPVFVRVSPGRNVADAEFETRLIWHLLSHGVRTPALFQAHNRQGYVVLKTKPAALGMVYEWIDGYERTDEEYDERHAQEVGQLLGQLHLCTANLPVRREGIYTPSHIRQRLANLRRHPRLTEELRPLIERLSTTAAQLGEQRSSVLPSGIGHTDLFPDNILFPSARCRKKARRGTEPGPWMIDLEQAAWTTLVYDLAVSLLACTAPVPSPAGAANANADAPEARRCGPLLLKTARAMVAGYQRMRLLSDGEWTALWPALRTACVRFATTRLTDVYLPSLAAADVDPDGDRAASAAAPQTAALTWGSGKVHSKDYRDYVYRLDRLDEINTEQLIFGLR
jgi:homoserine kinase type II